MQFPEAMPMCCSCFGKVYCLFENAVLYYVPKDVGIGVDIFAYTRSELEAMQISKNTFVLQALKEGMDLI